jgi:hypothetical protein
MSYFDSCVAALVGHRRMGDRVCAKGGGVGEEPAMVLLRSRRVGGRCCRLESPPCVCDCCV